jgi:hypothetical protein
MPVSVMSWPGDEVFEEGEADGLEVVSLVVVTDRLVGPNEGPEVVKFEDEETAKVVFELVYVAGNGLLSFVASRVDCDLACAPRTSGTNQKKKVSLGEIMLANAANSNSGKRKVSPFYAEPGHPTPRTWWI